MLNGLDLFSGIGGITLALAPWVRPIAYCENDRYAQAVLLSRMSDGRLPVAPIWNDVATLRGSMLPDVDIIYGGFPCQGLSTAGLRKGLADERSGLYWQLHRLVKEVRPEWVFLENVPGIRTKGLLTVVRSLAELRYDCRWTIVSAAAVGTPYKRKRWFLLANAKSERRNEGAELQEQARESLVTELPKLHASFDGLRQLQQEGRKQEFGQWISDCNWWAAEPDVDRVVPRISNRMDRVKCLGNSVVPLQAREAFKTLMGIT